ncbi:hypothetical protein GCM10010174_27680 [Kutzneria viridogrisea]
MRAHTAPARRGRVAGEQLRRRDARGPLRVTGTGRAAESVAADGDTELAMRILWGAGMRCFWTEPGPSARKALLAVADRLPSWECQLGQPRRDPPGCGFGLSA